MIDSMIVETFLPEYVGLAVPLPLFGILPTPLIISSRLPTLGALSETVFAGGNQDPRLINCIQ